MKTIKLNRGKVALVDDWAFPRLSAFEWRASQMGARTWYAYRNEKRDGKNVVVLMHSEVVRLAGLEASVCTDHRDGNGLNNQQRNLRPATTAQNGRNRGLSRSNTSGYKGVTWYKPNRKWLASITANGKRKYLGYFASKVNAALAYDDAARELHGEFARLNFPQGIEVAAVA